MTTDDTATVPTPGGYDEYGSVDELASALATERGSFELHFAADENYGPSGAMPWHVTFNSDPSQGWAGHTAMEALRHAQDPARWSMASVVR